MRKPTCYTIVGLLAALVGLQSMLLDCQFVTNASNSQKDESLVVQARNMYGSVKGGIYDPTPDHIWNRLHRSLYVRVARGGREYGSDELDPLLWSHTKHLLTGASHQQAIDLLDQFLTTNAEQMISDPLKKAMLQRDLWAVFEWSTLHSYNPTPEKRELQIRLAQVIRRLALPKEQIQALPNNYAEAVASKAFATQYDSNQPDRPFLPPDLFQPDGPWVPISALGGEPVALTHTFAFSGRSVFLVFMRLPEGREATLKYIKSVSDFPQPWIPDPEDPLRVLPNPKLPQFPAGTQLALVRQMVLIDNQANLKPTNLIEELQMRVHRAIPSDIHEGFELRAAEALRLTLDVFEYKLSRQSLFASISGGLRPVARDEKEFPLFQSHGFDLFEMSSEHGSLDRHLRPVLNSCVGCHFRPGIHSVLSRERRQLAVSWEHNYEANSTVGWKYGRYDWGLLKGLWELESDTRRR